MEPPPPPLPKTGACGEADQGLINKARLLHPTSIDQHHNLSPQQLQRKHTHHQTMNAPQIHPGTSVPISDGQLAALIDAHPKPSGISNYSYGTAGFRYDASLLPCVFVRMGIFAALRSASLGGVSCYLFVHVLCSDTIQRLNHRYFHRKK